MIPCSRVPSILAAMRQVSSVIRTTMASFFETVVVFPTTPRSVTTGISASTPSSNPRLTRIVFHQVEDSLEMMRAGMSLKLERSRKSRAMRRRLFSASSSLRRLFSARSSRFSTESFLFSTSSSSSVCRRRPTEPIFSCTALPVRRKGESNDMKVDCIDCMAPGEIVEK